MHSVQAAGIGGGGGGAIALQNITRLRATLGREILTDMFPAARVTDFHMCPMITPGVPPIPHVGGPILPPCEITVLTGGLPQARATDMALCVGPPDMIVMGSVTVLVGGLPCARIMDPEMHGGMIMLGEFTVLVGG
jgi:uncharacterized Zn-binding protein involved in type VI secretion